MKAAMTTVERGTVRWPTQLADLGRDEPARLWVAGAGDLRLLALRSVAIVGSREATAYGLGMAAELAADLCASGWIVVSGAAFGIDAAAHSGALAARGCTVAVLAGGVDVASPMGNAGLLSRIADSGLIVSERPPGTQPAKHLFLERNRLIAGLSRALIVVEAANRSGALNTATWAEGMGRHVLAVPGPASSPTSRGTHRMIRDRQAILVQDADDVLEVLEPLTAAAPGADPAAAGPPAEAVSARMPGPAGVE